MAESGSPDDGSAARVWLKPLLGFLAAAALLVLVGVSIRYEETATFRCPKCLSTRESEYSGFKVPGVQAFGGAPRSVVKPTALSNEVFGGKCAHWWPLVAYNQSGVSRRNMLEQIRPFEGNPLSTAYETIPRIRTFVRGRLDDGSLAKKRAQELFSLPPGLTPKQESDPALRLLMDEANSLLVEAGLPSHPAWAPDPRK